jgi:transposase
MPTCFLNGAYRIVAQTPTRKSCIMNNATFHKHSASRAAIGNAGCMLNFPPPYLPALNPLEKKNGLTLKVAFGID